MSLRRFSLRPGFTLIELLIVIGIITVLIAMLLPVLGNAKKQAAMVACQSNMRQLTQAALAYAIANDSQLPYCNWSGGGFGDANAYPHGWLFANNTAWAQATPPTDGMKTGLIWPYLQSQDVYHCNLDDPTLWTGSHWLTSYTMNGAQGGYGALGYFPHKSIPGLRLTAFKQASQAVMFWEATDPLWNDGSSYPTEAGITNRHYTGGNVSCFDGHVEWWLTSDFATQAARGAPTRLWCYPNSATGGS